jgi:hypothetical protein
MTKTVIPDVPFCGPDMVAHFGQEYDVVLNQHGAVSIEFGDRILGLKPDEFDVIERFRPEQ